MSLLAVGACAPRPRAPAAATLAVDAIGASAPAPADATSARGPATAKIRANALGDSPSPYLRQHAHNPVAWQPWGDAAFALARARDVPVFLSIGYATCHWCHVMAAESFEDPEIAAFLNAHYVPVKVDREQRPDVDALYLDVVQRLTGRGGWPLTVVLTPDREPFFGATYLPPRDGARGAREGLLTVLRDLATAWRDDRAALVARAARTSRAAALATLPAPPGDLPDGAAILRVVASAARGYDAHNGGFGRGAKFVRPALIDLLLRVARRGGDPRAREMALTTLRHAAAGGVRDHLGGGFHRYATDRRWRVPHFEKMLYDQALLACVYLDAAALAA
ncbi:MAG: thioredoxin domain-containing protein, partial [Myxococcales bacterium]|nr:thioredoxin domain-containing protein [Myxococcales bacterium]